MVSATSTAALAAATEIVVSKHTEKKMRAIGMQNAFNDLPITFLECFAIWTSFWILLHCLSLSLFFALGSIFFSIHFDHLYSSSE